MALAEAGPDDGGAGAVATFTGLVRTDDGVDTLELEHYPGATEAALRSLAEQATTRWALHAVTIVHRVGPMRAGERIVFVAAAAAHRAAALEACAYLIDRLKTDAPFWKREVRGRRRQLGRGAARRRSGRRALVDPRRRPPRRSKPARRGAIDQPSLGRLMPLVTWMTPFVSRRSACRYSSCC